MGTKKLTQSEIDGVEYRRAKLWQIILISCNALRLIIVGFIILLV